MTNPSSPPAIVPLRKRPAWTALNEHRTDTRGVHLRQHFAEDPQRGKRFTTEALGLYFDYSKHRITAETISLLMDLAEESGLRHHIDAIFAGEKIKCHRAAGCSLCRFTSSEKRTNIRRRY